MNLSRHLDKNNLHHAYLIQGDKGSVLPLLFNLLEEMDIKTNANPDFYHLDIDSFKIDNARNLKSMTGERGFVDDENAKKIFVISANSFLLEAQNSLLKVFEEPIENTHFFIISPSVDIFIPTLVSRCYLIKSPLDANIDTKIVEEFMDSTRMQKINFIKDFLKNDDEDDEEEKEIDSPRSKALKFLDTLELVLHRSMSRMPLDTGVFEQIFQARKYIRQPGSSTKSILESVALSIPEKMR